MATKQDLSILATLVEGGGSGDLDVRGRVCVGTNPKQPIIADPTAWLRLVADGLVAGEFGKIIVTETGREKTARLVGGYTAGHDDQAQG